MSSNEAHALSVQPCTGQACSACSSLQWPLEPGQLFLWYKSHLLDCATFISHLLWPDWMFKGKTATQSSWSVQNFSSEIWDRAEQLSCTLLFSRPALALGFSVFPLISKSPTRRKTLLHLGDIRHFGNQNCVTAHGTSFVYVYFLKVKIKIISRILYHMN